MVNFLDEFNSIEAGTHWKSTSLVFSANYSTFEDARYISSVKEKCSFPNFGFTVL